MITVIIPVLNEERTVGNVVRFCFSHPLVTEVVVVDDNSEDNTVKIAQSAGATVITSAKRGKGISMREGVEYSGNDILVFLDGDIDPYPFSTISSLAGPIVRGEFDFMKATFSRNAGRVTELLAKPLLSLLYPDLARFHQPLSGMIAGRKALFQQIDFFPDYGVDIGILIDMSLLGARIGEANIGYIENKSKAWTGLAKMSTEVASAILHKAMHYKSDLKYPLEEMNTQTLIKNLNGNG
jgi:glycosyltransferase involved in cell wall biosynthesis